MALQKFSSKGKNEPGQLLKGQVELKEPRPDGDAVVDVVGVAVPLGEDDGPQLVAGLLDKCPGESQAPKLTEKKDQSTSKLTEKKDESTQADGKEGGGGGFCNRAGKCLQP